MSFYKPEGKYTDLPMPKYCAWKANRKHDYSDHGILNLRTRVRYIVSFMIQPLLSWRKDAKLIET